MKPTISKSPQRELQETPLFGFMGSSFRGLPENVSLKPLPKAPLDVFLVKTGKVPYRALYIHTYPTNRPRGFKQLPKFVGLFPMTT